MSVCYITAIYGNYEATCKPFVKQTIDSDFICFTNNLNIESNGWTIDNTPYHLLNKSSIDNDSYINSLCNNQHNFNIAKYYKQSFHNIPILKKYSVIVWMDGTLEITHDKVSEYILENIYEHKIIGWHHEYRHGTLNEEVFKSCDGPKYQKREWLNQKQPVQNVVKQFEEYIKEGYSDDYFKNHPKKNSQHFGVWITCFVAFLNNNSEVKEFLDLWYKQTLMYTTQDQVGFPYVCQKLSMVPLTLPNSDVSGPKPHTKTRFYVKRDHGK
jgi:hypothetical protein